MIPAPLQEKLEALYWSGARAFVPGYGSHASFRRSYLAVRLSRNLQVLGAYGFLGKIKGKRQFLRYIPGALKQLRTLLRGPCRGLYPRLERVLRLVPENPEINARSPLAVKIFVT
jgi:hypothetical protein